MLPRVIATGAAIRLEGPLVFLRRTLEVGLNEAVEVFGGDQRARLGRVAALADDEVTIELLESSAGLALSETKVRFLGEPITFGLGADILGRVFNGVGEVIDGGPPIALQKTLRIDGLPLNPVVRATPHDFIETGITAIDLMNSLVRGQKLPIFSGGGLPHDRMAVEIACNARLRGAGHEDFAIVFAAIGVPCDSADYFRRALRALRGTRARGDVPQSGKRFLDAAAAHAAVRTHRGRVSRLRGRQARARDPHRPHELLRGAAGSRRR
jgi:V/A-type H+-transporting ATPase subunit B